jgi:pimeloyl-ACP methyl ester carboxylesterase
VRTSTLTIGNQTVEADWYFPTETETPTRLIYLQHGLLASGPMYSYTAATLAEQTHSIVVAPSLTSNWFATDGMWLGGTPMQQAVADLFVGQRTALTESASAAAGYDITLPDRFVLAGHSLGGSLVMGAAGDMVGNGAIDDLAGVLLLDSVDVGNSVPTALQKLTGANDRPVYNISSERYVWNMDGLVDDELEAARPGRFNGVMLVGGRHIDALQGGNPLLQLSEYLVAGFSQSQNIEAVKILAVGWVNDMFAGTHDGIYGAPQETIEIPATAGTATAVVLPPTSSEPIQGTPFDWLLRLIFPLVGGDSFAAEPVTV